jgi:hypothetical protein
MRLLMFDHCAGFWIPQPDKQGVLKASVTLKGLSFTMFSNVSIPAAAEKLKLTRSFDSAMADLIRTGANTVRTVSLSSATTDTPGDSTVVQFQVTVPVGMAATKVATPQPLRWWHDLTIISLR